MTTPIKTQCPQCNVSFHLQQSQLDQLDAKISCAYCQHQFFINKSPNVEPNAHSTSADNTKVTSDQASDALIHDDMDIEDNDDRLIHDDMDNDHLSNTDNDYDSLDSMDAWLNESNHNKASSPSTTRQKESRSSVVKNNSANSQSTSKIIDKNESVSSVALSSVAANDINATLDNANEESWLEQLLEEHNGHKVDSKASTAKADTDLSQLLTNMGVPLKDNIDARNRLHNTQTNGLGKTLKNRPSLATLFWIKGCLLLALLLFAQYVIFNLNTLIKNPAYAQHLQAICSIAACSLPSAELSTLSVSNMNHRPSQVKTNGAYSDIQANITNENTQAQLLPHLKVGIYSSNALIGEFIAAPEDYLLSSQSQLSGGANKSFMFTIPVANNQINAITIDPIY